MLSDRPSPQFRRHVRTLVACWTGLLLVLYFWPGQTILDRMELYTIDWRFRVRGPQMPDPRIAIVAVDDHSINTLGRWPWPRSIIARGIAKLDQLGAERIIFDIFFTETANAEDDRQLVDATREFGRVYHAGFANEPEPGQEPLPLSKETLAKAWDMVKIEPARGLAAAGSIYQPRGLVMPLPELTKAAQTVGFMNVLDSGDGVFRNIPPLSEYEGHIFPALVLAAACDMTGVAPEDVHVTPGHEIRLGDKAVIPLDSIGRMMVDFIGGTGSYPSFSMAGVLEAQPDSPIGQRLNGKTVFVAVTASGFRDLRPSPFDTIYSGVETQANALDAILNNKQLRRVSPLFTAVVVICFAVLFALVLVYAGTAPLCVAAMTIAVGYVWSGILLFRHSHLIIDLLLPCLAILGFFVSLLILRLLGEERRRRRAQQALSWFVPPTVADRLVTDEAINTMSGERRDITVLFADLRGFTSASEGVPPEATVELLNRYFDFMHEVIWDHEGTLDKYIGDEIMAFFNAPMLQADHAKRAVRTALAMQRRIHERRDEWRFLGMPDLAAGIGISTGHAVIGYVGSQSRMQYTAIGHHVNIASRLQGLSKELGQAILISESTYAELGDDFEVQAQGAYRIRGVGSEIEVYSVLGPRGQPDYIERVSSPTPAN
jgi:adenylate cyclase